MPADNALSKASPLMVTTWVNIRINVAEQTLIRRKLLLIPQHNIY
jgi:hypothetical protein